MHPDPRVDLSSATVVSFACVMSGPDPKRDAICSIGAVRMRAGAITDEVFSTLVDPGRPVAPAAQIAHGLSDRDLAGQPRLEAVLPAFREFIGDSVPIAHHAAFDLSLLGPALKRARLPSIERVIDTAVLGATLTMGQDDDVSFESLCAHFRIPLDGRHTALGDARLAARLLMAFLPQLEARASLTLERALHWGDAYHPNATRMISRR